MSKYTVRDLFESVPAWNLKQLEDLVDVLKTSHIRFRQVYSNLAYYSSAVGFHVMDMNEEKRMGCSSTQLCPADWPVHTPDSLTEEKIHSFNMLSYLMLTALSSPRLASCSLSISLQAPAPRSFQLREEIIGSMFYDAFNFQTFDDPARGRVNYVDQDYAKRNNLTYASESKFVMRADSINVSKSHPRGRDSVRIASKQHYEDSVLVLDLAHMPTGCGTWPEFWTRTTSKPPLGGQIDIIEGVNTRNFNLASLHTTPGCNMTGTHRVMTGDGASDQCDATVNGNQGCGVNFEPGSFGQGFNSRNGGWYAMSRTQEGISIWFWDRDDFSVPEEVQKGTNRVQPELWGVPVAAFPADNCDMKSHFGSHEIVFHLTFCGGWAGNDYPRSGCPGTCVDFVDYNPNEFVEAYWEINSLRTYV